MSVLLLQKLSHRIMRKNDQNLHYLNITVTIIDLVYRWIFSTFVIGRRDTNNVMAKKNETKKPRKVRITLHKLKTEQLKNGVISGAPGGWAVHAPHVAPLMLLKVRTKTMISLVLRWYDRDKEDWLLLKH